MVLSLSLSPQIAKLSLEEEDLPRLSEEDLSSLETKDVEYQITMLEETLKQMSPNMAAIEEFKIKVRVNDNGGIFWVFFQSNFYSRFGFNYSQLMPLFSQEALHNERLEELMSVTNERDQARGEYEGLRTKRLDEFMAGFTIISVKLKEMYQVS